MAHIKRQARGRFTRLLSSPAAEVRNAGAMVAGTFELLECARLQVDMRTLLRSRRVNRAFKATIDRSTKLQQAFFLKALSDGDAYYCNEEHCITCASGRYTFIRIPPAAHHQKALLSKPTALFNDDAFGSSFEVIYDGTVLLDTHTGSRHLGTKLKPRSAVKMFVYQSPKPVPFERSRRGRLLEGALAEVDGPATIGDVFDCYWPKRTAHKVKRAGWTS
ncbi:hypothetical protein LTR27_007937 [Elasticomyces elasticus]|nr:hypothetical protein LTR27_007937 [Elasticomyces elasticus]